MEKEVQWASQEQPVLVAGVWLWDRRVWLGLGSAICRLGVPRGHMALF